MGLFGGFKAKFTGNSAPKNKQQEVVCLSYHIHPEFDGEQHTSSSRVNQNVKKVEVVRNLPKKKERKAVKSAIFPEKQPSAPNKKPQKSKSITDLRHSSTLEKQSQKNGKSLTDLSDSSTLEKKPLENGKPITALSQKSTSEKRPQENGHIDASGPITVATTFSVPSNEKSVALSNTTFEKSTEDHNGVVTEKVAVVSDNHLYTNDNGERQEQHNQAIFKSVSTFGKKETVTNGVQHLNNSEESLVKENGSKHLENDPSTLIFMTQHSSRSSSMDRSMEFDEIKFTKGLSLNSYKTQDNPHEIDNTKFTNGLSSNPNKTFEFTNGISSSNPKKAEETPKESITDNLTFVPNHASTEDDVDYFKVNVVKHDLNRMHSYSEDEYSHHDEEEPRFVKMGYSSQAASIFFGEGETEEVARPRRIQLKEEDDDERRSSGADC